MARTGLWPRLWQACPSQLGPSMQSQGPTAAHGLANEAASQLRVLHGLHAVPPRPTPSRAHDRKNARDENAKTGPECTYKTANSTPWGTKHLMQLGSLFAPRPLSVPWHELALLHPSGCVSSVCLLFN